MAQRNDSRIARDGVNTRGALTDQQVHRVTIKGGEVERVVDPRVPSVRFNSGVVNHGSCDGENKTWILVESSRLQGRGNASGAWPEIGA